MQENEEISHAITIVSQEIYKYVSSDYCNDLKILYPLHILNICDHSLLPTNGGIEHVSDVKTDRCPHKVRWHYNMSCAHWTDDCIFYDLKNNYYYFYHNFNKKDFAYHFVDDIKIIIPFDKLFSVPVKNFLP